MLLLKVEDMTLIVDDVATMMNALADTALPAQHTSVNGTYHDNLLGEEQDKVMSTGHRAASSQIMGLRTIYIAVCKVVCAIRDIKQTKPLLSEVCQDKRVEVDLHEHARGVLA